jgi:hypothetical protein
MTDWSQEAIEQRVQNRVGPSQPAQVNKLGRPREARLAGVVVTDIRMSFGSMVIFMVKWAIASIPALLILSLLGLLCWIAGLALLGVGGLSKH